MGRKRLSQAQVISNFLCVHRGIYDYHNVEYVSAKENVFITCPQHGDFPQTPSNHLSGSGCPKCHVRVGAKLHSSEEFIASVNKVHGGFYTYPHTVYTHSLDKVSIVCPIHGPFQQIAANHKHGRGCDKCAKMKKGKGKGTAIRDWLEYYRTNKELGSNPGIFYKLHFKHQTDDELEFIKIGITSRSIQMRYYDKQYNDYTYQVLEEIKCTNLQSAEMEEEYMRKNADNKFYFPEGIKFDGYSECFRCPE